MSRSRSQPDDAPRHLPPARAGYFQLSQQPLHALLFLSPLLLAYEVGTMIVATDPHTGATRFIYARSLLQDFFEWFGVTGYYLPGLITITVLLAWHFVRRDPFDVRLRVYGLMGAESLAFALPLFVTALVFFRGPAAPAAMATLLAQATGAASTAVAPTLAQKLLFSIGAGIYEELLFRLIAIALLHMLFVDVLALPSRYGALLAVLGSAALFSAYHFSEGNPFQWGKGIFYFAAGVYFAAIYVLRGFGVVAGTHAIYDVLVVLLQLSHATASP